MHYVVFVYVVIKHPGNVHYMPFIFVVFTCTVQKGCMSNGNITCFVAAPTVSACCYIGPIRRNTSDLMAQICHISKATADQHTDVFYCIERKTNA